jgi:ubiquinone/menaquinone biosynthesis C-methylase UbiE
MGDMQASISFDRAANFYDETRGFPPIVGSQIVRALSRWIDPADTILDIGTGTGRIALPLLQRGFNLTGIDLSSRMLNKFQLKALPGHPRVVLGDAHSLPFPDGCFHSVMSVQLLHLVADWRLVIEEARRVMMENGVFLLGYSIQDDVSTPEYMVSMQMREELKVRGVKRRKDFLDQYTQIHQTLVQSGANYKEITAATWNRVTSANETLENLKHQVASHSWNLPDAEYFEAVEATRAWAYEHIPEPGKLYEDPRKFIWQRYQW